jgi:hypothetical protein
MDGSHHTIYKRRPYLMQERLNQTRDELKTLPRSTGATSCRDRRSVRTAGSPCVSWCADRYARPIASRIDPR